MPSGDALTNEPFEMKVAFRFNLSDMMSGHIDAFTASAEASGREYGEQTMRQLLKCSGTISEAMGNAVAGKGRRLGWPVILEVLEGVEIDFDENGEPEQPKMSGHECRLASALATLVTRVSPFRRGGATMYLAPAESPRFWRNSRAPGLDARSEVALSAFRTTWSTVTR